jgi:hypothetical protein
MDLNNYWQENKRFLVTLASGAIVFVIGLMVIDKLYGDELVHQRAVADSASRKLKSEAMYKASDLATAQSENEALKAVVDVLQKSSAFHVRPLFVLDPKRGSPSSEYFAVVSSVREELLTLCGRANLRLPEDLGLPALSPTRDAEIERTLEALDMIDRVVRLALSAGCERIDKIEIKLDPRLTSRQGVGSIERTRVAFTLSGKSSPMVQLLSLSQGVTAEASPSGPGASTSGAPGAPVALAASGPLLIEKSEMQPRQNKPDEAALEVTFVVARLAPGT